MSKFVKLQQGNYQISVPNGKWITLDVGRNPALNSRGTVYVTGNLVVEGTTTTIDSQTMTVADRIITLNEGDTGAAGITGLAGDRKAGIEVIRGTNPAYPTARLVVDDEQTHRNSLGNSANGIWSFRDVSNNLMGIQTSSVDTNGKNLYLDLGNGATSGYISVKDVTQYERKVFDYSQYLANVGPITVGSDKDAIPNVQGVLDCITSAFTYQSANNITDYDTSVTVADFQRTGNPSLITFKVDNSLKAFMDGSGVTIDSIKMFGNTIASINSTTLILSPDPTSKTVQTSGWMLFENQSSIPSASASGTYLYSNATIGAGKTGLYIVNTTVSDELVSKKRALLFSMIF